MSNWYSQTKSLQYSEVFLVPQYSEVTSRSEVDTSVVLDRADLLPSKMATLELDVPVISANMDTVTNGEMAIAMYQAGAIGAIHRFMSIEQNVAEFDAVVGKPDAMCFVSVGVTGDARERAVALHNAGARYFIIDIAHGHSKMMKDMIEWMRNQFSDKVYIMAGNVATREAVTDLAKWGADAVKIGIGPGAVCTTKNVTGVTYPQFTAVTNCCNFAFETWRGLPLIRVADGGIQEIGDIAKALGAGADLVMCGRLFAGCQEAPGPRMNGQKIYRGMASRDAMLTIRSESQALPTPEGISTLINESAESAKDVVQRIKGGLQSSFSYANARNLIEFQHKATFGIRS